MTNTAEGVLQAPLTPTEITARLDKDGFVNGLVLIDLDDIIGADTEDVMDLFSESLVGSCLGMDISYKVEGTTENGTLIMRITLDPSTILEDEDDDMEDD